MNNKVYYGEYSLKHWINLVLKQNIILPEYQRYFVWNENKVKTLIETFKNKEFVPPVTIGAYKNNGNNINLILDGQQRITSILLAYLGLFPDKKGLWIVYGNFNNENKLSLSTCSPTQSKDFGPGWPPPPEFKRDKFGKIIEPTETDSEINYLKFNIETLRSFIYQLEQLRIYKLSQNKLPKNKKNTIYEKATIISLIINILLFAVLIYFLARKRFYPN